MLLFVFVSNSSRENFRGTDHHTITANILGGILRDALKIIQHCCRAKSQSQRCSASVKAQRLEWESA